MSYRTILSVMRCEHSDHDLKSAIALSRSSGVHLTVLLLKIAAPPPIGEYAAAVSPGWLEERDADRVKLAERAAAIRDVLQSAEIPHEVVDIYTEWIYIDSIVGRQARYADLVLVGGEAMAETALREAIFDGAIFHAGTPALVVPRNAMPSLTPGCVVLAWTDSPEAARAAKQAVALFRPAKEVRIGLVDPDSDVEPPGAEISVFLARHGINTTCDKLRSDGRTVAETLKQYADDVAADVIVMGAYGHSRLREWVFGGVTRSMLNHSSRPVFFAR